MPFIETPTKRILFIHIPKTGGTSLEKAMEAIAPLRLCVRAIPAFLRVPPEHFTCQDIHTLFDDDFFDYSFTIVRDPYSRIESEYRLRTVLARERNAYNELPKFPVWLEQALDNAARDKTFLANHLRPQVDFLGNGIRIFKYEQSLDAIVDKINAECDLDLKLPPQRHLSTLDARVDINWNGNSVNLVNRFYYEDFEALGYQKRKLDTRFG